LRLDYIPVRVYRPGVKLRDLKATLALHPDALPRFIMPDGDRIPAHFHITEVGHMAKRFIDCGGKLHDKRDTCLLQTYVADDVDHQLTAGKFAKILQLGDKVLPHDDVEVEVEYEDCSITQSPITSADLVDEYIELQLGEKHTDCLAKERCGIDGEGCSPAATTGVAAGCC
jgi:hypothetical protein